MNKTGTTFGEKYSITIATEINIQQWLSIMILNSKRHFPEKFISRADGMEGIILQGKVEQTRVSDNCHNSEPTEGPRQPFYQVLKKTLNRKQWWILLWSHSTLSTRFSKQKYARKEEWWVGETRYHGGQLAISEPKMQENHKSLRKCLPVLLCNLLGCSRMCHPNYYNCLLI